MTHARKIGLAWLDAIARTRGVHDMWVQHKMLSAKASAVVWFDRLFADSLK